MTNPNAIIENVPQPSKAKSKEVNQMINEEMKDFPPETRIFWLFLLATRAYEQLGEESEFDLMEFQLAAEQVSRQVNDNE